MYQYSRMYKYYIHTEDAAAKRIAKWYVATILVGSVCWFCDRVFCERVSRWPVNPQGHALWHCFMGFNSYCANTFLMFCRAQKRGWSPKVREVLSWSSSLCQDREAENAMRGRAQKKQIIYIFFFVHRFVRKFRFFFLGSEKLS